MYRQWFIIVLALFLPGSFARGHYLFTFEHGSINFLGPFEVWGYQIPSWYDLPDEERAFEAYVQPNVVYGINSLGFALHDPAKGAIFFRPDGQPRDQAALDKFTKLAEFFRYSMVGMIVNPFSTDRRAWLASPDAYRTAMQVVAKAIPEWHSTILVIGDPFSSEPWPAEAPLALNDPAVFAEMAGLIKQNHPKLLLAIPAASFPNADKNHWLYVSSSITDLTKQIQALSNLDPSAPAMRNVLAIPRARFFISPLEPASDRTALAAFMKHVEQTRLAVHLHEKSLAPDQEPARLSPEEETEGWQLLFDGQTLNGWTTLLQDAGGWIVHDGLLHCTGVHGPWLRTRQTFDDFILRIEFKIEPNGNSGVFLRAPLDGRASRFGMEIQISGKEPDSLNKHKSTGAIYAVLPPLGNTSNPPGQWNYAEITCRGSRVTMTINGQPAQNLDMNDVPELHNRLRRGVIGLQDHGNKVWFRNIRIKCLKADDHNP
ncbi:MAG: DUF1080 domain-containing protein [Phycisphaerales bacterium]|nr:DUF1080 domain-containing protein [Phycisphaerales bacterium]